MQFNRVIDADIFRVNSEIPITASSIFDNNLRLMIGNISGIVAFGIPAIINLVINGAIMGLFLKKALSVQMPLSILAQSTLPHFLEYIALWITGSIGLHGIPVLKKLLKGSPILSKTDFIKTFIVTGICLLFTFIAANIEATVCRNIINAQ